MVIIFFFFLFVAFRRNHRAIIFQTVCYNTLIRRFNVKRIVSHPEIARQPYRKHGGTCSVTFPTRRNIIVIRICSKTVVFVNGRLIDIPGTTDGRLNRNTECLFCNEIIVRTENWRKSTFLHYLSRVQSYNVFKYVWKRNQVWCTIETGRIDRSNQLLKSIRSLIHLNR